MSIPSKKRLATCISFIPRILVFVGIVFFGINVFSEVRKPVPDNMVQYAAHSDNKLVVSPFFPVTFCAQNHVIAFFNGDREYESLEAFIYKDDMADTTNKQKDPQHEKQYLIHAIMTYHNKHQDDYYNFTITKENGIVHESRNSYQTDATWRYSPNGKDCQLTFRLKDGRKITLIYLGDDKPTQQWGGMTDVGGHAPDGGWPLFYRGASGMALKKSYVRIDDKKYTITVDNEISKPPFFIGYKAFASIQYHALILETFTIQKPLSFFSTQEMREHVSIIRSGNISQKLVIDDANGFREIKEMVCSNDKLSPHSFVRITFTPNFPNLMAMKNDSNCIVHFAVYYNDVANAQADGEIVIQKSSSNTVHLQMNPSTPKWAVTTRQMDYIVQIKNKNVEIVSQMRKK